MSCTDHKNADDMVLKKIFEYQKMYKISDKLINFITNAMENWRSEFSAGRQLLAKREIPEGIFQGQLAVTPAIRWSNEFKPEHIYETTKFSKSPEKNNPFTYMDDINVFAKKWKKNWSH